MSRFKKVAPKQVVLKETFYKKIKSNIIVPGSVKQSNEDIYEKPICEVLLVGSEVKWISVGDFVEKNGYNQPTTSVSVEGKHGDDVMVWEVTIEADQIAGVLTEKPSTKVKDTILASKNKTAKA